MTMYVGLDVHSKQSVFVVENEIGTVMARGEVPTSTEGMRRLREEARLPAGTRVALETGTTAFFAGACACARETYPGGGGGRPRGAHQGASATPRRNSERELPCDRARATA